MTSTASTSRALVVLLSTLLLSACAGGERNDWTRLAPDPEEGTEVLRIVGTVRHLDVEGGVHVIRTADGTTYHPVTLPEAFRADGLEVEAEARRREDMMSIGMVGQLVELIRIREVSEP